MIYNHKKSNSLCDMMEMMDQFELVGEIEECEKKFYQCLTNIFTHADSLDFTDKPDYEMIISNLKSCQTLYDQTYDDPIIYTNANVKMTFLEITTMSDLNKTIDWSLNQTSDFQEPQNSRN